MKAKLKSRIRALTCTSRTSNSHNFKVFLSCKFTLVQSQGNGTPLQYSCLENPTDEGAWWAVAHGVAKSQTRLDDFTFTFQFHALEKAMATHSSSLACKIHGSRSLVGCSPWGH